MLGKSKAFASFAVDNVAAAKLFYGETLGLELAAVDGAGPDGPFMMRLGGGDTVLVYPRPGHRPAAFTVLTFPVPDLEATVDELGSAGVVFERYVGFDTDEKGIHRAGGNELAWFTDPAGNILALVSES
jgi:catechol 2,3-dioxygenase-like lactoylglutathione lyase family enzyme